MFQRYSSILLTNDKIVFTRLWYNAVGGTGTTDTINSMQTNGGDKKELYSFDASSGGFYGAVMYKPNKIYYYWLPRSGASQYFAYENGTVKPTSAVSDQSFYSYPTGYAESPSGKQVLWSEKRDSKNTIFVGDKNGENGKQMAALSNYSSLGWYTDDYLLLTNDQHPGELYILPSGATSDKGALRITDYPAGTLGY